MTTEQSYQSLAVLQREIALLYHIEAVLEWDQRTYLPNGGADYRANQLAYIAVLRHRKVTDAKIGDLLAEVEAAGIGGDGLAPQDVNVREWRRDYNLKTKLPEELVAELSRTAALAQSAWRDARANKDFPAFQPWLEKTIELKKRQAECLGWKDEPYDALLDEYEPGAKTAELAKVLADLRDQLVPLVQDVAASPRKPDTSILHRDFPESDQEAFGKRVAAAIGYDFDRGRLDVTAHPFCSTLGPKDVRITTRYIRNHINGALFGTMHESGHALYEQHLPAEHAGTPMCEAVSLGIHESQSRLWENIVGRSRAFWEFWYGEAQRQFAALRDVSLDTFVFAINSVKPSFIRVEADEMTYNLHILLRFELERALMSGDLAVADVPGAWNEKFIRFFGLNVPDDAQGCLQDIHWGAGLVGYFPTYTLGNLNAAQFYETAVAEIGDQEPAFRKGEFKPLLEWLAKHIHSEGRRYRSAQLTKVVSGKSLDSVALMRYLRGKAEMWYGVK